ncbi:MAG: hypothetical protein M3440_09080, partial [Chloroflexota bacterium]|nr:hypothetical protein [Chloroflexota bacterium]
DLDRELCDLGGGAWWEFGSNYGCVFDDWELNCENDGADCKICEPDKRCERIVDETYRQPSLADDQQVVEPVPTATPPIRGRGRSTTADEPVIVASLATPGPTSIVIIDESPTFDPTPVMIDPAQS